MNRNFRPEPNSNKDNIPQTFLSVSTQSPSSEETSTPISDDSLNLEDKEEILNTDNDRLKRNSQDYNQQLKYRFKARIIAALTGAAVMLPVLAVGTATYYFGSRVINRQEILLKRGDIPDLVEAELTQERQLLAILSIGTGATALLAGTIAALWVRRANRSNSAALATIPRQSPGESEREEEPSSEENLLDYLSQPLEQAKILALAVQEAQKALKCDRVVVYSLDRDNYGKVIAESVSPGWTEALGITIQDPCFEARYIDKYRDGRVKALNNIYEADITPCYLEQLEKLEVKANLVTPILDREQLFGLLVAHHCATAHVWQPEEIDLLTGLAQKVGSALDNTKLLDDSKLLVKQTEEEVQWLEFLTDATRHIHQSLQQEDILNVAVEEVQRIIRCDRVVVYSLDSESRGVVVAESVSPGWTRALGLTIKDPCFEARYLEKYQDGRVRALDNIYEAGMTSCYLEQLEKLEVKANLVTPIINQGKIFGLLVAHQCSNPRTWQQQEIHWVTQIATQVGFALDNAKLLAESTQIQAQAETEAQWTQFFTDATRHIRQSLNQKDVLNVTVEEVRRVLNCQRVVVYSLNRERYGVVVAESVAPGWTRALGITIKDPCFEARYLDKYENGRVRALDNIYEAEVTSCYLEQLEKLEVKANLVTPIINEGKLFGLLVAHQCSNPRIWQQYEIRWVTQIATQVGFALDNAQLLAKSTQIQAQAETEAQWTKLFTEAIEHIRQSLKQEDVLDVAVEEVRRVLDCQRVVVYSLNQDRYGVVVAESVAPGWTRALGITIQDPCFEARYLDKYRDGRVRALNNIYEAGMTSCYLEQLEKLEVKANLVTPIINEGKLFGLLVAHQCSSPRIWQQYEIRWVTQIATQVGFALDNATLLRQLETASLPPKSLNNFILRLGEQQNEQDLLKTAVEEARQAIDTERVIIYSFDADWYGTVVAESVLPGFPKALQAKIKDPCFARDYAQKYYHGRIQSLDNIYEATLTDCHREQLEQFAVKASLVVPIISQNKLFGLLIAHQCSHPRSWQQPEIDLFAQLAVQVGWALQANSSDRPSLPQIKDEARTPIEAENILGENQNKSASVFESQETRKLPEATLVNKAMETTSQHQQVSKLSQNTRNAFENLFVEATEQSETIANLLKQMQTAKDSARAITVSLESLEQKELTAQNKQVRSNKITLNHNLVTLQAMTIEANTTIMQIGNSSQKLLQTGSSIEQQIKQQETEPVSESRPNSLISIAERVSPLTNRLTKQTAQIEALIKGITLEVKEVVNLLESDNGKVEAETGLQSEIQPISPSTAAINNKINDLTVKIAQAVEQTQNLAFINQFILQVATLANQFKSE